MITDEESLSKLLMDDENSDFLNVNYDDPKQLNAQEKTNDQSEPSKQTDATATLFDRLPLTVTLEVGSVSMTLGDLKAAKSGDVIPLGRKNGDLLDVKVNGELFAKAEVVTVDNHYALRFVSQFEPAMG